MISYFERNCKKVYIGKCKYCNTKVITDIMDKNIEKFCRLCKKYFDF